MGKYPLIKKTEVFIPQALKPIQAIMKRKILFYGILLLLSSCTLNNVEKNESKELKVLSWNVWHGGHSKEYPQKGCDGTKGILKESKAVQPRLQTNWDFTIDFCLTTCLFTAVTQL